MTARVKLFPICVCVNTMELLPAPKLTTALSPI